MLGVQAKQKKVKHQVSLPHLKNGSSTESLVSNPFGNTIGANIDLVNSHNSQPSPMVSISYIIV